MEAAVRYCLNCEKPLRGRADKKFCDDACRNNYNNQQKTGDTAVIRKITGILKKNRNILAEFLPSHAEHAKTTRSRLAEKSFQFHYFTHQYKTQKDQLYYFVFDYGYLYLDNDWMLIVRDKKTK